MSTHRSPHVRFPRPASHHRAASLLLVAALCLAPGASRAAAHDPPPESDGWGDLFRYAGCAASIVVASGTAQLWVAYMGCAQVIIEAFGE